LPGAIHQENDMHVYRNRAVRGAGALLVLAGVAWIATPVWAGGAKLQEGKAAPDIELPATSIGTIFPDKKDAKTMKISDLKGKKNLVLWFYPKALTGG
jgi:hypothetical protein